jgi:hypothetical protein
VNDKNRADVVLVDAIDGAGITTGKGDVRLVYAEPEPDAIVEKGNRTNEKGGKE